MKTLRITNNSTLGFNIILEPWAELRKLDPSNTAILSGEFTFERPIFSEDSLEIIIQDDEDGLGLSIYVPDNVKIQLQGE